MPAGYRYSLEEGVRDYMKQQVNLFQPIFREQKKVFSAITMLQVTLLALLFLFLTGGYSMLQLHKLQVQDATALQNLERLKGQIAALEAQTMNDTTTKLLAEEINRITSEVDEKQQIADLLKHGPFNNTQGFSRHFEALAKQHVNGTWLKDIKIANGGSSLSLDGITYSPELVPVYLQKLLQEEVFSGTAFNVLGMERSSTNKDEITFQVSTHVTGKHDESS